MMDKALYSVHVGFLSASAVVLPAYGLADAVEQAWFCRLPRKTTIRFKVLTHFLLPNTGPIQAHNQITP